MTMQFASLRDYANAVKAALPQEQPLVQEKAEEFVAGLAIASLTGLETEDGESLETWFQQVIAEKVRFVVGESRGPHRGERTISGVSEWPDKMLRAASTDGALGFELLSGLLCQTAVPLTDM